MAVCGRKRLIRMALAALPVLLFLAGVAHPAVASAATRPITLPHPSCFCGAELHAGRGVVNVLAFDIDRDGDTDLVELKADLRIRVWLNNGRGEFVRRNRPDLRISFGSKLLTRDSEQTGSCCSSAYDDGASLAGYARTTSIGPELSASHGFESSERPATDPFLTSIHPRGPPPFFA